VYVYSAVPWICAVDHYHELSFIIKVILMTCNSIGLVGWEVAAAQNRAQFGGRDSPSIKASLISLELQAESLLLLNFCNAHITNRGAGIA
jgi:hypothetical protein